MLKIKLKITDKNEKEILGLPNQWEKGKETLINLIKENEKKNKKE